MKRISKGVYQQDDSKPCTCRESPMEYQGSHVLPSNKNARDGTFDLGAIPSYITRNGRDDAPDDGNWWPWLRVSVNNETVVLTRKQVERIRLALIDWLARTGE